METERQKTTSSAIIYRFTVATIIAAVTLVLALALCGCTTTRYVPVERVHTEYRDADTARFMALINSLKDEIRSRESHTESLIHKETETVRLNENGDTVFRDRLLYIHLESEERSEYEHLIESQHDSIGILRAQLASVKADSVPVPYPVERKPTAWERVKQDAGGWALAAVGILAVAVAWLAKRQRKR